MGTLAEAGQGGERLFVSTGHLPSPEQVRREVDEAYERYRTVAEGERSRVYPALAACTRLGTPRSGSRS
jgi:hypothetical protein